jgi:hypothetical protein
MSVRFSAVFSWIATGEPISTAASISFSSPLSTRANTPARRNSLLLIAVLPNLAASRRDLQIRGRFYCRNVAKRGHFYCRRMGIIIVARHIQFSRCPEGIQHSRHRAIHPRHQCRGFSRWIGNFRESRLNQLASPQTASKTPNATSHFGKSPISPAEIESSTDPGGRSNLRRRKGARRRNRAPLILFCTRAAGVRSYKPSA